MRFFCRQVLCLLLSVLIAAVTLTYPVSAAEQAADTVTIETASAEAEVSAPSDEIPPIERENWLSVTTEVLTYYAQYAAGLNPEVSEADIAFYDADQNDVIDISDATYFLQIYAFYGASLPYEGYIPVRAGTGASEGTEPTVTTTTTDSVTVTTEPAASETTVSKGTSAPAKTTTASAGTTVISGTAAATVTTAPSGQTSMLAKPTTAVSGKTTTISRTTTVSNKTTVSGSTASAVTTVAATGVTGGAVGSGDTTSAAVTTAATTTTTALVTRTPMAYGIDVSVYQGEVDWEAVKDSGVEFAIIRAGYGRHLNQEDKYFDINMQNAQAAGIDCGAYWFSYATTPEAAVLEADVFYEVIKDYKFEYPVFFDYETSAQYKLEPEENTAIINAFCERMESYGYYVSLCSYVNFLNNRIEPAVYDDYDTWIAHYNVEVPDFEYNYGMWQFSCTGTVPGIDADVDLNYAYVNYPQKMIENDLNGFGDRVTVTETTTVPADTATTTVKTTAKTTAKATSVTAKVTSTAAKTTAKTTSATAKVTSTAAKTTAKTTSATAKVTSTAAKTTAKATSATAKVTSTAAKTTAKTTVVSGKTTTASGKTTTAKTTVGRTTSVSVSTTAVSTTAAVTVVTTATETTRVTRTPMAYGIDVSVYQGEVDWEAVKDSGVEFAIIRAGYGRHLNQEDKYFDINMQNAQAAGIDCGAYWFSYATTPEAAVLEADVFYEVIKDYKFEYPVFFDYETSAQFGLTPEESTEIITAFCERMESYGYYVSLCSYVNFLNQKIEPAVYDDYDTWIAHYDVDVPNFKYNYGIWQFSCTGTVPGIDTDVDLNYAYYDYPRIMIDNKLNGF